MILLVRRTFHGIGSEHAPHWYIGLAVILATLLLMPGVHRAFGKSKTQGYLVLAAFLIPFVNTETAVGAAIVALAGICSLFRHRWTDRFAGRFEFAGYVWLIMAGLNFVFVHLVARMESFGTLATVLGNTLKFCGEELNIAGSSIFINSEGRMVEVLCSADKFGGVFPLLLWAGMLLALWYVRVPRRTVLMVAVLLPLYTVIRTATVVSALANETISQPWWNEYFIALSFAPFIVPVFFLIPRLPATELSPADDGTGNDPPVTATRRGVPAIALAVVGGALLVLGGILQNKESKRKESVVIDEAFSRWEWSETSSTKMSTALKRSTAITVWPNNSNRNMKCEGTLIPLQEKRWRSDRCSS